MNKKEANNKAKKLKEEMEKLFPKSTWNVEVWHNIDWCYKVHCGTIGVYAHDYSRGLCYSLSCGSEIGNTSSTPYSWSLSKTAETISEIKDMVIEQLERVSEIAKDIENISRHNYEAILKI